MIGVEDILQKNDIIEPTNKNDAQERYDLNATTWNTPKPKRLFYVDYVLNSSVQNAIKSTIGWDGNKETALMSKHTEKVSKPNWQIDLQKNNQYNRVNISNGKVQYGDLDVTILDTMDSSVMKIIYSYMYMISGDWYNDGYTMRKPSDFDTYTLLSGYMQNYDDWGMHGKLPSELVVGPAPAVVPSVPTGFQQDVASATKSTKQWLGGLGGSFDLGSSETGIGSGLKSAFSSIKDGIGEVKNEVSGIASSVSKKAGAFKEYMIGKSANEKTNVVEAGFLNANFFDRIDLYEFTGNKMTIYNFNNPKIKSVDLDSKDITTSDYDRVNLKFEHEGVTNWHKDYQGPVIGVNITPEIAKYVNIKWYGSTNVLLDMGSQMLGQVLSGNGDVSGMLENAAGLLGFGEELGFASQAGEILKNPKQLSDPKFAFDQVTDPSSITGKITSSFKLF